MHRLKLLIATSLLACTMATAFAAEVKVKIYSVDKDTDGKYMGYVRLQDSQYGMLIEPHLKNLSPGLHGFHVHVNPSCADNGMAAGGHLDPQQTSKHLGPYNPNGHLGDLPALYVAADGTATLPNLAPRLKVSEVQNHSLMIHEGGDNYSDKPAPLGGGGMRMECGVIK